MEPPLELVGISHKTAPIGVRECVAVSGARLAALLEELADEADEAVVVSTCNRTEVYLVRPRRPALEIYRDHLGHYTDYAYRHRGLAALRHLFRVAAGLDSLVVGEAQILGQVKSGLFAARKAGTTGPISEQAFQTAIAAGKRARAETAIGRGATSVAYAAVDLARAVFGDLAGLRALVLGAGEMAERVLEHLAHYGAREVWVLNRTPENAEKLAGRYGGRACGMEHVAEALAWADIVIASAAAPHYVVRQSRVCEVLERRTQPLFLIDIALPRNVDPAVARLPGAYLYNLDDLETVAEKNRAARAGELPRVERIVADELAGWMEWYAGHVAADRIQRLKAWIEDGLRRELEAALGAAARGEELERLVRRLSGKTAHPLIQMAKDPKLGPRLERMLEG
ncbi:glutamyl-tRNA reductase [Oceanithermus sp.]|uniref:glutamyl-tRNA reductase n=1 Tax=Oceanithermus sp. TaxID=2268145 RepID=UPI00257BEBD7|nr:glutamyl-tRNA reductase [Oceanithermus sp.]